MEVSAWICQSLPSSWATVPHALTALLPRPPGHSLHCSCLSHTGATAVWHAGLTQLTPWNPDCPSSCLQCLGNTTQKHKPWQLKERKQRSDRSAPPSSSPLRSVGLAHWLSQPFCWHPAWPSRGCVFLRSCGQPGGDAPPLIFLPPVFAHLPFVLTLSALGSLSPANLYPQAPLCKEWELRHSSASHLKLWTVSWMD